MIRACALLAVMAVPVQAAELSVDPDRVASCHANAPEGTVAPDCIGVAADACQKLAPVAAHSAIATCLQLEAEAWEVFVEAQVTRHSESISASYVAAFETAQSAWQAYRTAQCALVSRSFDGSPLAAVAAANCTLTQTAARSLTLRDLTPR